MSKAMDALNIILEDLLRVHETRPKQIVDAIALLRDYITTTEARETAWAIALAGEQLAHETDLTQSAARIKELEELLREVIQHINPQGHATLWKRIEAAIYGQHKAALDGARKVGAEGLKGER